MNEPTRAEMEREIRKQEIALQREIIARKERNYGECVDVFYARKLAAVGKLIAWQRQLPDLFTEDGLALQALANDLNEDWERALEIEQRRQR